MEDYKKRFHTVEEIPKIEIEMSDYIAEMRISNEVEELKKKLEKNEHLEIPVISWEICIFLMPSCYADRRYCFALCKSFLINTAV